MSRIKWKVMRTLGMLPSSTAAHDMNDAQWIWSYLNIIEDQEEEEDLWKARLKYMGLFVNPEMVEAISKAEAKDKGENHNSIYASNNDSSYNSDFADELSSAMEGEQFMELPEPDGIKGNSNMSSEEFLDELRGGIDQFSTLQQQIDLERQAKEQNIDYDLDIIKIDE